MNKYKLGIDIGGTFIKYALVDESYNIKDKWKVECIKFDDKDLFYDYVCSNIKDIDNIDSIGISAPGLIDKMSNVNSYAAPNVIVMYGTNIIKEINKRTGKRVAAINDAKAAGLCELKIGNARGSKSSAFLIIGTGTGGCLCDKDGVIFGTDGYAGEFHNLPFINFKTCEINSLGDYSSMTALIKIYNEKVDLEHNVRYGHEVCQKYLINDKKATETIEEWLKKLVVQLITITSFYNPEVICIGGGISEEEWFINSLRKAYKDEYTKFFKADFITTRIEKCKYNNDANILGAIINIDGQ